MNQLLKKLWNDQGGFILSTEATILWTITVLGTVVGLVAVRNAAVTEHTEMANTLLTFDQTYSYSGLQLNGGTSDLAQTNGANALDIPGTSNVVPGVFYGISPTGVAVVLPTNQVNVISVAAP